MLHSLDRAAVTREGHAVVPWFHQNHAARHDRPIASIPRFLASLIPDRGA
jgi:hypothetical protein